MSVCVCILLVLLCLGWVCKPTSTSNRWPRVPQNWSQFVRAATEVVESTSEFVCTAAAKRCDSAGTCNGENFGAWIEVVGWVEVYFLKLKKERPGLFWTYIHEFRLPDVTFNRSVHCSSKWPCQGQVFTNRGQMEVTLVGLNSILGGVHQ